MSKDYPALHNVTYAEWVRQADARTWTEFQEDPVDHAAEKRRIAKRQVEYMEWFSAQMH